MKNNIIESISERGNGEIYLGVVGAVRTGKSTFIKKVIENLVVPNIENEIEKKRCIISNKHTGGVIYGRVAEHQASRAGSQQVKRQDS